MSRCRRPRFGGRAIWLASVARSLGADVMKMSQRIAARGGTTRAEESEENSGVGPRVPDGRASSGGAPRQRGWSRGLRRHRAVIAFVVGSVAALVSVAFAPLVTA